MSKDFNVYKWRRDYLAESVSREEQEDLFTKGWIKAITSEKGTKNGKEYTHVLKGIPAKQYERILTIVKNKGYEVVADDEFDKRGTEYWLYLIKSKK